MGRKRKNVKELDADESFADVGKNSEAKEEEPAVEKEPAENGGEGSSASSNRKKGKKGKKVAESGEDNNAEVAAPTSSDAGKKKKKAAVVADGNDFDLLEDEAVPSEAEEEEKKKKKKKAVKKKEYPYHPDSGLVGAEGYLGGLTEKQQAALNTLKLKVEDDDDIEDVEKHCLAPAETEDTLLLRFLRARSFDTVAAFKMFKDFVLWREKENIAQLARIENAKEILGCDEMVVLKEVPHWLQAYDKQGRPVIIKEFGHCHISNMLAHTTQEKLQRYHIWCNERYALHLASQSEATGHNIETSLYIVDAAGWHLALATKAAYAFLQGMSDVDNSYYPERLGTLYVINAPKALSIAWAIIKRWLDVRTREKINILSGMDQWAPVLKELVDPKDLPEIYGGTGKSKKPEIPAE